MSETFHPFPLLPAELRLSIWQLTIRDTSSAGVNYCELSLEGADTIERGLPSSAPPGSVDTLLPATCKTLDVPCRAKCIKKMCRRCFYGNASSYLIDSGLWNACKESREVMLEKFGRHRQRVPLAGKDLWLAAKTFIFRVENDVWRHATVFPGTDLFIVPILHLYKARRGSGFVNGWFHSRPSLDDLRHLAVRFDPYWEYQEYASVRACLSYLAFGFNTPITVYLIDYRLQRRERPFKYPPQDEEPRVFHASNGKFIEVLDLDEWDDGVRNSDTTKLLAGFGGRLPLKHAFFLLLQREWEPRDTVGLLAWESD